MEGDGYQRWSMVGQPSLIFFRYQSPPDGEHFADLNYDHCCVSNCHLFDHLTCAHPPDLRVWLF